MALGGVSGLARAAATKLSQLRKLDMKAVLNGEVLVTVAVYITTITEECYSHVRGAALEENFPLRKINRGMLLG